jgi:hypothetical protein
MDRELYMLADLRQLSAEINDLIFTLRERLTPAVLQDELEGIIARRMLSLEVDKIRESRFAGKTLYEVQFKNLHHRLHVPKHDIDKEEYKHLLKRLREEIFNSVIEKREVIFDAPKRWVFLPDNYLNNVVVGYSEVIRFTTDLPAEYRRCRNCVESTLNHKPTEEDWVKVLTSVKEDKPAEPFMEKCMIPCELIDIVAEVEEKFDITLDAELKKAFRKVY